MSSISDNLQAVQQRIAAAARAAQRDPAEIALLAVSKTFGAQEVIDAAEAGQRAFGENYLQEALDKIATVRAARPDLLLEWHFIGPIQSNKTPLNVCLQINISGEASKSGATPQQVAELAQKVATLPRLKLCGLMAIPEPADDAQAQRVPFRLLRKLLNELRAQGLMLDTLSMGMSADLDAAIAEGATIVRVGTAIFGKRDYAK